MAINELAVVGYWFYGAADDDERASLYASWGLIEDAPAAVEPDVRRHWSTDGHTHWEGN